MKYEKEWDEYPEPDEEMDEYNELLDELLETEPRLEDLEFDPTHLELKLLFCFILNSTAWTVSRSRCP
jgi:hypothetical protein